MESLYSRLESLKKKTLHSQLHMLGFRDIDGVDPSQGMIDVARGNGLYRQLVCSYVGVESQPLPFEDSEYC